MFLDPFSEIKRKKKGLDGVENPSLMVFSGNPGTVLEHRAKMSFIQAVNNRTTTVTSHMQHLAGL